MTGPCFATFRSRGPQPPAAEARKINRSRDCCVPRRLRPFAHNIIVQLNTKAGASGAATSTAQLQAARGDSGLTKGEQ